VIGGINEHLGLLTNSLVAQYGRFEAYTAVIIQIEVFWVVTPYSVLVEYQRFRDALHFTLKMEAA
jgi:hypothetical protein